MQSALLTQSFGAYVALLAEERGWSKTSLAGAAAMQSLEAAILGPLLGWVIDRFGPQAMIRWGVVVFAIGFVALSQIESISGFYVSALILAVGASSCGYFPLTVAIIHWFERQRARALSLLSLGLALGGLALGLVLSAEQAPDALAQIRTPIKRTTAPKRQGLFGQLYERAWWSSKTFGP